MNRSQDRHIVDVRDVFPGHVSSAASRVQGRCVSPADDTKHRTPHSNQPTVCATNSDVYFSSKSALVGRLSSCRTKRPAPLPPLSVNAVVHSRPHECTTSSAPLSSAAYHERARCMPSGGDQSGAVLENGLQGGPRTSDGGGQSGRDGRDEVDVVYMRDSLDRPPSDSDLPGHSDHTSTGRTNTEGKPNNTTAREQGRTLPRQPLTCPPPAGAMVGQGRGRAPNPPDSTYSSDTEEFDEEEVTVEFGLEEEDAGPVEGRHTRVYQEYQGDDFGQYLEDDRPQEEPTAALRSTNKRRPRRKAPTAVSPTAPSSNQSGQNTARKSLKKKLGGIFMGGHSAGEEVAETDAPWRRVSSIHSYTFADCKMGTEGGGGGEGGDSTYGTLSRSDTSSNISSSNSSSDRTWWNADTLSARTLHSNSDVMLKPRRRGSSVSDLTKSISAPTFGRGAAPEPPGPPDPHIQDFESYRKNLIYDTKTGGKKTRKGSIFHRIMKKDPKCCDDIVDNTVINPLTEGVLREANGTGYNARL